MPRKSTRPVVSAVSTRPKRQAATKSSEDETEKNKAEKVKAITEKQKPGKKTTATVVKKPLNKIQTKQKITKEEKETNEPVIEEKKEKEIAANSLVKQKEVPKAKRTVVQKECKDSDTSDNASSPNKRLSKRLIEKKVEEPAEKENEEMLSTKDAKASGTSSADKSKVDSSQVQAESISEVRDGSSSSESESDDSSSEIDDGELDDDGDSDFDPDNDPEKLWCFCKKTHGNRFMICCDTCEGWFHGDCVGVTMAKGREMEKTGEEWCCKVCLEKISLKKVVGSLTTPLNSPLKKAAGSLAKPLDASTLTKARSLSLDSMKNNLAKSLRDKAFANKSKQGGSSSSDIIDNEEKTKTIESSSFDSTNITTDINESKTEDLSESINSQSTDGKDSPLDKNKSKAKEDKNKRRESDRGSFSDLITFDHVPASVARKDSVKKERRDSFEEERRKRRDEMKSKVHRTPTPKTSMEPVKLCLREDCQKPALKNSIYCSRECIYKYSMEAIKVIEEDKKKAILTKSPDTKQETKGATVISPATSSTDRVTETTQERIAVFEKLTGKIVAGVMAPTRKYLFAWLEEHPTYQILKSGKQQASLKNPKKEQDEMVRSNVRKSLREILITRCKDDQMAINLEALGKICMKIENRLLKMFGETSNKYKTKYRSLIFNLKDSQNKILYKRVVSGEISPKQLVAMTPEQLATPELAQWRKQENRHHIEMVKKREQDKAELSKKPMLKKTYKGEVEIDGGNETLTNLEIKSANVELKPAIPLTLDTTPVAPMIMNLLKDTTEEHNHHLFDSNCKICTGKIVPPGESQTTGVSTTVLQPDVQESTISSPNEEEDMAIVSSPASPDTSTKTPPSPTTSLPPPPSTRKQPSVWRGFVMMQKVSKFVTTAYAVSGTCQNLMEVLPDTVNICGRIPPKEVWEYLAQLKAGRTHNYIDVIRFEMSTNEEKAGYIKLYTYFYTRQRFGVVGNCFAGVKDMYILPLASSDPIPNELKPLPGLPKPRPHMLLGIIVRIKSRKTKLNEFIAVDSSPETSSSASSSLPKKRKKKKEKKKEKEIDKEKVELEAQKKLVDIIFKTHASTVKDDETSTSSLAVNPLAFLKSITTAASLLSNETKSDSEKASSSTSFNADTSLTEEARLLEEAQMQKLKEQQTEIERLKKEVGILPEVIITPDPRLQCIEDEPSSKNNEVKSSSEINKDLLKTDNKNINIPSADELVRDIRSDSRLDTRLDTQQDTRLDSQKDTTDVHMLDQPKKDVIPLLSNGNDEGNTDNTIVDFEVSSTSASKPKVEESSYEKTTVDLPDRTVDAGNVSLTDAEEGEIVTEPCDDDYVSHLIDDIKLPKYTPNFPLLNVRRGVKEPLMPELPAIQIPGFSPPESRIPRSTIEEIVNFRPPLPGSAPQIPLPPNIKLPPGVPFPPLPPRMPAAKPIGHDSPISPPLRDPRHHERRVDEPRSSTVDPRRQSNPERPFIPENRMGDRPPHDFQDQRPPHDDQRIRSHREVTTRDVREIRQHPQFDHRQQPMLPTRPPPDAMVPPPSVHQSRLQVNQPRFQDDHSRFQSPLPLRFNFNRERFADEKRYNDGRSERANNNFTDPNDFHAPPRSDILPHKLQPRFNPQKSEPRFPIPMPRPPMDTSFIQPRFSSQPPVSRPTFAEFLKRNEEEKQRNAHSLSQGVQQNLQMPNNQRFPPPSFNTANPMLSRHRFPQPTSQVVTPIGVSQFEPRPRNPQFEPRPRIQQFSPPNIPSSFPRQPVASQSSSNAPVLPREEDEHNQPLHWRERERVRRTSSSETNDRSWERDQTDNDRDWNRNVRERERHDRRWNRNESEADTKDVRDTEINEKDRNERDFNRRDRDRGRGRGNRRGRGKFRDNKHWGREEKFDHRDGKVDRRDEKFERRDFRRNERDYRESGRNRTESGGNVDDFRAKVYGRERYNYREMYEKNTKQQSETHNTTESSVRNSQTESVTSTVETNVSSSSNMSSVIAQPSGQQTLEENKQIVQADVNNISHEAT